MSHLKDFKHIVEEMIPFNRYLGIQLLEVTRGRVKLRLPFKPEFIGDPTRPALHGGVISTLMDTAGGAAAWTELGEHDRLSTVDLLIDYLAPASLKTIDATAEVIRIGNRVAVTNISVHQEGSDEIIAQGRAVYNIHRKGH